MSEGPLYCEVTTIYGEQGSAMSFRTNVRIYEDMHFPGIEVANFFDFGTGPTTDLDVFMRLTTDIQNLDERGKPVFCSDLVSNYILHISHIQKKN